MSNKIIKNRILIGLLNEFIDDFGLKKDIESKAFEKLVNYVCLSKTDPDAFSDTSIFDIIDVDQTSTFGIDTFALFINDNLITNKSDIEIYRKTKRMDIKFVFIQTKRSTSIDSGELLKFISAVKNFFSDTQEIELSNELLNAKELVNELFKPENARLFSNKKPTCELLYATTGKFSTDSNILGVIKREEKELLTNNPEIKNFKIKQIDADYIIDSYNEIENRYRVVIDFDKNIPCGKISEVEQSYIGYLSGVEFLKLISSADGTIRKNLFYENVRDFQGADNVVNGEISKTLNDSKMIDKFLLLNNGVTIVAKEFSNIRSNEYEISDYYIVNGCQTSNVIYNFKEYIKDDSNLNIPIKIIHTDSNELITQLIKSTNRQTSVPDEAFVSLEKFHKRLQEFYRVCHQDESGKLYYERRSKEFNNSMERIERPRIVSLHAQIRSFASVILGEPQLVMSHNPSTILKEHKDKLFVEGQKYILYYLASLHLYTFYRLSQNHHISNKYTISRYWICWIANVLAFESLNIGFLNSDKIEKKCDAIITKLGKNEYPKNLYKKAINIFESAKREHIQVNGSSKDGQLIRLNTFKDIVKRTLLKELANKTE